MLLTRLPFHYSWVVIGILATVQVFAVSIAMAAGIMVPPLNDPEGDFRWGEFTISAGIASYFFFGAIYAPITGWLGDRYGSRKMLLAAGVMFLISMILLSQVREVWHFFLFFGVLMSMTESLAMVPLMAAAGNWFRRRLGLGVGILWAAGGIGTAILAPVVGYLIDAVGWEGMFMTVGLVGGITMLVLVPFMRNQPADLGIEPYGARPGDTPLVRLSEDLKRLRLKVFNRHTRRTRPFWNLPLVHGMGCAGHAIVLIFVIPLAYERGVFSSLAEAGIILTLLSLVSIVSRFVTPILAESYGTRRMMALSLSIQGSPCSCCSGRKTRGSFICSPPALDWGLGGSGPATLSSTASTTAKGPWAPWSCHGWQTLERCLGHATATICWPASSSSPQGVLRPGGGMSCPPGFPFWAGLALSIAFSPGC